MIQERLVWAVLVILAVGLGIAYERHQGAQNCVSSDVQAGTKQEVKIAAAEGKASEVVKEEAKTHAEEIAAPVVAPHYRMCPAAQPSHPGEVLPAARAGSVADAGTRLREADQGQPAEDWDSRPTVTVGRDADSQVRALQAYIRDVCTVRP